MGDVFAGAATIQADEVGEGGVVGRFFGLIDGEEVDLLVGGAEVLDARRAPVAGAGGGGAILEAAVEEGRGRLRR